MLNKELNIRLCDLVWDYKILDSKDSLTEEEKEEHKKLEQEIWTLLLGNV